MAFANFTDRLPDPNWTIGDAGQGHASSYTAGPGFASVKFSSEQPISVSRTNSGRVTTRAIVGQRWKISVTYNPMTRAQFEPVYNFLLGRRGRLKPFRLVLPQYTDPQNSATNGTITVQSGQTLTGGEDNFLVSGYDSLSGSPKGLKPGDLINIADGNNSNHKKAYQIIRVADSTNKLSSDSALNTTDERRFYIVPPLEKAVAAGSATVDYGNPMIRVIMTNDVTEYSIGTNNLYQFSLNLEEAQA